MPNEHNIIWELMAKKLSGEATAADLAELEALLRQHPDVHYAAEHLTDLWAQKPPVSPGKSEQAFADHLDRMRQAGVEWDAPPRLQKRRIPRPYVPAMAAAVLLFAALAGWWWWPRLNAPEPAAVVHAEKGTRTRLALPDGSVVWLNSDSRLTYGEQFSKRNREVNLEGEAFFDVVADVNHPFVIHTSKMNVKVLGTAFNVRAYPNDSTAETALIRGSVEVSRAGAKPVILKANEKLVLYLYGQEPEHTTKQQKQDFTIAPLNVTEQDGHPLETAWVENKLAFRDEAFSTLAARLERWYGVQISLADPAVKNLRFTGRFEKETIEQVLKALQITAEFRYSVSGRNITISQN